MVRGHAVGTMPGEVHMPEHVSHIAEAKGPPHSNVLDMVSLGALGPEAGDLRVGGGGGGPGGHKLVIETSIVDSSNLNDAKNCQRAYPF